MKKKRLSWFTRAAKWASRAAGRPITFILAVSLILVWAITAVYFSFPDPFERTMDYYDTDLTDDRRPGDWLVKALVDLHFGRSWGMAGKWAWVVLGLVPAALFITGCITWWLRVVRRRAAATPESPTSLGAAAASTEVG